MGYFPHLKRWALSCSNIISETNEDAVLNNILMINHDNGIADGVFKSIDDAKTRKTIETRLSKEQLPFIVLLRLDQLQENGDAPFLILSASGISIDKALGEVRQVVAVRVRNVDIARGMFGKTRLYL